MQLLDAVKLAIKDDEEKRAHRKEKEGVSDGTTNQKPPFAKTAQDAQKQLKNKYQDNETSTPPSNHVTRKNDPENVGPKSRGTISESTIATGNDEPVQPNIQPENLRQASTTTTEDKGPVQPNAQPTQLNKQQQKANRKWTTQSLKALVDYIYYIKEVTTNQSSMNEIDLAIPRGLIINPNQIEMEKTMMHDQITKILVERTNNHNFHLKEMLFRKGKISQKKGSNLTAAYKAKQHFKEVARPRTSDYGIELGKSIIKNIQDAREKRNNLLVQVATIDKETSDANMAIWKQFLEDVKEGDTDELIDGKK